MTMRNDKTVLQNRVKYNDNIFQVEQSERNRVYRVTIKTSRRFNIIRYINKTSRIISDPRKPARCPSFCVSAVCTRIG